MDMGAEVGSEILSKFLGAGVGEGWDESIECAGREGEEV